MNNSKNKTINKNVNSSYHYRKIILSNIKHDLTNPINAILGYSEIIIDIMQNEDQNILKRDIQAIYDSGNSKSKFELTFEDSNISNNLSDA